jgi:hypothetical protein
MAIRVSQLKIAKFLFLIAVSLSAQTGFSDGNSKALSIAESSPRIIAHFKELLKEAGKIKNKKMRVDALAILNHPEFQILRDRKQTEGEIKKALLASKLIDEKSEVFPVVSPMAFIAAPASPWRVHHCYPGGLVDHTLTNLKSALGLARTYQEVYDLHLDLDVLRLAPIWHDYAKTMTVQWNEDGTANSDEGSIAGTGRHHILGIAEAIYRGYPASFIVVLASAHQPATPHAGLEQLLGFLKAAAIIAGKPYEQAGLNPAGDALLNPAPIESFIHHLSDHDWVLTQVSLEKIPPPFGWVQNEELSHTSDLKKYEKFAH